MAELGRLREPVGPGAGGFSAAGHAPAGAALMAWGESMRARREQGPGTLLAWLLTIHAMSMLAFALAYLTLMISGTNRLMVDLYLGMGGFLFGVVAVVASLAAAVIVVVRQSRRHEWPWLFAHAACVAVVVAMASGWLATHIA